MNGEVEYKIQSEPERRKARVDCKTSTHAFEVDFGSKAYEGLGQALYYAYMTNLKPGILLIHESKKDNSGIGRIRRYCEAHNIDLYIIDKNMKINHIVISTQEPEI